MKKMMRTTLLLVMLLGGYHFAQAQFSMGVHAGFSVSDVHVNGAGDFLGGIPKAIVNPSFGIVTDLAVNDHFSFAPELHYAQKGFSIGETFDVRVLGLDVPVGGRLITRLHYIDMPLLAKGRMDLGGVQLFAAGGPSIGYAVKGELDPRASILIDFDLPNVDIPLDNNIYNRWEIGAVASLGFEVPTGTGTFYGDIRYQHGLTNMLENPLVDIRLKNEHIVAGVGYRHYF